MQARSRPSWLRLFGPGLLVAATGVGAGDLATAAFTGNALGVGVLWAVLAGAWVKFALNEGLARFQLATGETLIEGALRRLGRPAWWLFLAYFLLWSFLVAGALMSACGAAAHAIWPLTGEAVSDKILYGLLHSAAGVILVRLGGYRLFEKVMGAAVGVMFVTVVVTALRLTPDWAAVASGLVVPIIPRFQDGGLAWTLALAGGVGGTVTVLCYGYWIREEGREGPGDLPASRLDLGVGYGATALFGLAMVVIGSTVTVSGQGVGLIVALADRLGESLGPAGRGLFLAGAWAAVASSLLGVWQSVPYLFADLWRLRLPAGSPRPTAVDISSRPYRLYLHALATLPALGLLVGFARMQKLYAITGAAFMPILAAALLWLNRRNRVGEESANRPVTVLFLVLTLVLFLVAFARILG